MTTGVYTFGSDVTMNSDDITISGNAEDIFIIQMTGSLKVAANIKVKVAGGAQAKNIFWQVAGYVNVGAQAHMEGILLVKTNVTLETAFQPGRSHPCTDSMCTPICNDHAVR